MSDRELLELAARAAGMEGWKYASPQMGMVRMIDPTRPETTGSFGPDWNPLADDGDALRLAAALRIDCEFTETSAGTRDFCYVEPYANHKGDRLLAVRRAIVRAAAEIGRRPVSGM